MLMPWPYTLLIIKPVNGQAEGHRAGSRCGGPSPDRTLGAACTPAARRWGVLATALFFGAAATLAPSLSSPASLASVLAAVRPKARGWRRHTATEGSGLEVPCHDPERL